MDQRQFKSHQAKPTAPRGTAALKTQKNPAAPNPASQNPTAGTVKEIGGPSGPEPTRYGDWERKGICVDF